jgi:hypothetical protein
MKPDGWTNVKLIPVARFRLAITSRGDEGRTPPDVECVLFVLPPMVEALSHAAPLRRPPRLTLAAAKEEAVRAVLAYLRD